MLYKLPPFNYKYSMKASTSLAQISGEQAGTSERLSIGVRLGAAGIILAISLAAGRKEAAIVALVTMACLAGLSLAVHILHIRKRTTSLFLPAIILDFLAILLMGGAALSADRIEGALSTLFILEGYSLSVTLLAALRMSVRDCVISAVVGVVAPALVSGLAFIRFPGSIAATLLIVPALNTLVGAFATLACQRYTRAQGELRHRGPAARQPSAEDDYGHRDRVDLQPSSAHQQAGGRVHNSVRGRPEPGRRDRAGLRRRGAAPGRNGEHFVLDREIGHDHRKHGSVFSEREYDL